MARIAAVKIWGFRSHVSSLFALSPGGLTVITGKNDAGKSAFIQAIKWVAFGEPTGEDFLFTIRDETTEEIIEQAEEAGAEITLDDGVNITKTRRKGKTTYKLSTIEQPFEKAEVPQEVTQALGLTKQNFGDFETAINFAYQLDAPFILSEAASVGAKVLGKLAGTEVVDLAIKAVAQDTYQARQERKQAEKEAGQKNIELLEYQDLDAVQVQLEACETLVQQLEQSIKRRDKLKGLSEKFMGVQEIVASSVEKLEKLAVIHELADDLQQAGRSQQRHNKLEDIRSKFQWATLELGRLTELLDKLSVIPDLEKDLQNAEKAQQRYNKLLDLYSRLGKATATVDLLTERLIQFKDLTLASGLLISAEHSSKRYKVLSNLFSLYLKQAHEVKKSSDLLEQLKEIDAATVLLKQAEEKALRFDRLEGLFVDYQLYQGMVKSQEQILQGIGDIAGAPGLLESAIKSQNRLGKLRDLFTSYTAKNNALISATARVKQATESLEVDQKELEDLWQEAGGVCPLCNQKVGGTDHGHAS